MTLTSKIALLGFLTTALAYPIVASATAKPAAHNEAALIVQAKAAFEKGQVTELERIAAKTKGHLLAAWPDFWVLSARITSPNISPRELEQQVQSFVKRHPTHPLAQRARLEWIDALAKRGLWEDVFTALQALPDSLNSSQIDCARAKSALFQSGLFAESAARVAARQDLSHACLALIGHLAQHRLVDTQYLRQRLRWASQTAGPGSRSRMLEIIQAHAKDLSTERTLAETLNLARSNSLQAYESLAKQRKNLSQDQAHYAAFSIGAALWQRSHPNAWPLILEGWPSLSQQPGQVLQMAAREALRRHEWPRLLEIIGAMQPDLQQEPTWRYWKAVGIAETQDSEAAREILSSLNHDFGFYGVLARERLQQPLQIPQAPGKGPARAELRHLDQHPGIQRSYMLIRAGLRAEAVQEWSAAMRGKSDSELLLAARHAQEQGLIDRMIAAADRTREQHDFALRYPALFKDRVLSASQAHSLDPWWVLGLIRQESRFIPNIRSSVGATGLMQIMPATGRMLAKQAGLKNTRVSLEDVDLNIKLGTKYLRQLHDRFDGSALLASAAYNAGPARAARWRSALPKAIDGAAFTESIPFSETRDYVKRVLTNAVLYHAIHNGGQVPSLQELLGEIIPRPSS